MIALMQPSPESRRARRLPAALVALVTATVAVAPVAFGAAPVSAAPAQAQCGTDLAANPAAPQLAVGATTLRANSASTVTVAGSRYLTGRYLCGGSKFGGVYVFFGWVQPGGQWGPSWRSATSSAGQFGTTYTYPGEGGGGETRDDGSGTLRLVSFTAGGVSGSETPFHMDANGNWSTTLTIRGPVYTWKDLATGASQTVDCRVVQCGVYTTGAHGIASRSNEQFVPVTFAAAAPTTAAPAPTTPVRGAAPAAGGSAPTAVQGAQAVPGSAAGAAPTDAVPGDGGAPVGDATTTTSAPGDESATEPGAGDASASTAIDRSALRGAAADDEDDSQIEEAALVRVDDVGDGPGALPFLVAALALLALAAGATTVLLRRRAGGSDPVVPPEPPAAPAA